MAKKKPAEAAAPKDNSLFWSMMSVAVAFVGAAVAKQLLNLLWRAATGKNPPTNPSSPDVQAGEAVTWAVERATGWNAVMEPWSVLLAVGFAGLVGVFFGYYPARRAARLQPIVALRHE